MDLLNVLLQGMEDHSVPVVLTALSAVVAVWFFRDSARRTAASEVSSRETTKDLLDTVIGLVKHGEHPGDPSLETATQAALEASKASVLAQAAAEHTGSEIKHLRGELVRTFPDRLRLEAADGRIYRIEE